MNNLSNALTILSSMITPVVLILASGSLIMTTSQRLSRGIERTRKLSDQLMQLAKEEASSTAMEQAAILFDQLQLATRRARLLQRAMTYLYVSLSIFVATSISLGVVDISHASWGWVPIVLGVLGSILLFTASIVLIKESRLAVRAVNHEMRSAILSIERHFPLLGKKI